MGTIAATREFLSGRKKDSTSEPPYLLSIRSSTTLIVLTINLAIFTDIFFYALIIPVIPFSLTIQVGISEDQVQHWTSILLACYSVALFVGSPIIGVYADHTSSRRWPLLIGLVALAGSTLLLCLGNSIGLLVLGRLLQGLSAAVVWSVGCALLVDTMDSAVGVAMGYVNISMSVGLLIAPVIGGAVYKAAGYYAVYYIAFGIVALDILLRLFMIEKKVARQWIKDEHGGSNAESPRLDLEKAESTGGNDSRAQNVLNGNETGGSGPAATNSVSTAGRQSLATPTHGEAMPRENTEILQHEDISPSIPAQNRGQIRTIKLLLTNPRMIAALYGLVVEAGIMMGYDATLPLFVQSTFHWDSLAAGILFLAIFLPGFVSPLVGWFADRYGAKYPSFIGFCATVPLLVCLRFVTENTINHKILLGFLLAMLGTALAFSNTPLMAEISYVIDEMAAKNPGIFGEKGAYGLGYGLFTMAFALGGTIGPLWSGYVISSAGWGTMSWSFAIWASSGALVVYIWLGGKVKKTQDTEDVGRSSPPGS
ncbi:MFS general substrate transporter [Xylariomycetidae sp. FL2044]|nr:MFS general substrate transporter [Xylariomycetidae sp. FL2044]